MSSLKEPSSTPEGLLTIAILSAAASVDASVSAAASSVPSVSPASSAAGSSVSASASVFSVVSSAAASSAAGCVLPLPHPNRERVITEERIIAKTFFFILDLLSVVSMSLLHGKLHARWTHKTAASVVPDICLHSLILALQGQKSNSHFS